LKYEKRKILKRISNVFGWYVVGTNWKRDWGDKAMLIQGIQTQRISIEKSKLSTTSVL
jgi:hypothetical protein